MSIGTIKINQIEMDFCCEKMEGHLIRKADFILDSFGGKMQAQIYLASNSFYTKMKPVPITYCPFCGDRITITYDPHDKTIFGNKE